MGDIFRFFIGCCLVSQPYYYTLAEGEIENEIQSSTGKTELIRVEISDSLQLESYELSEVTDELKSIKRKDR